jgi:hypothetical protein
MKNAAELERQIQKIKSVLAEERESIGDFETLIGERLEGELWGLSAKALEKAAWDSFFFLERNKDALVDEPVVSHRRLYGPVIVLFKKAFRSIMRPYAKMVLARQSRFNKELVQVELANLLRLEKIEKRLAGDEGGETEPSQGRS